MALRTGGENKHRRKATTLKEVEIEISREFLSLREQTRKKVDRLYIVYNIDYICECSKIRSEPQLALSPCAYVGPRPSMSVNE